MNSNSLYSQVGLKRSVPLFKIYWDEEDIRLTSEAIKRGMHWTYGPDIEAFEGMLAEYIGTRYCLVFNSGTSALYGALLAYGIGEGDEVIVPSFSFIAAANAPLFAGARPVFADIEERTYGLDPEDVRRKITPKTRAIIPVHYGGCACRIGDLRDIAAAKGLVLIEDAAEALGARVGGRMVGTFGDSAILSFCQNKIITTGEGGAVVTNSREIYEKLKLLRSQGRLETANYFTSTEYMDYIVLGYNFRLSGILAALGISQLRKADRLIEMRRRNAGYMGLKLSGIEQVGLPMEPEGCFHVYQMYSVMVKGDSGLRDRLRAYLADKGVMTKVNFHPVHLTRLYRERFGHGPGELPVTERVSGQVLTLPMYPALSEEEIDYVGEVVVEFFRQGG